jgi:hypothetical protein
LESTKSTAVQFVWDLDLEKPTLGGALVLRQEGELLAEMRGQKGIQVFLSGKGSGDAVIRRLKETVYASSRYQFNFENGRTFENAWPTAHERASSAFSYFSFSRLIDLYRTYGLRPRLRWCSDVAKRAIDIRKCFSGKLVAVHLRNVPPYTEEESNANGAEWGAFFAARAHESSVEFLLVGYDAVPAGVVLGRGVHRATDLGIDLATELELIGRADGFLGMASGICTAANLSETPHVIFKHPAHHTAKMETELVSADQFPFATNRQRLWRQIADESSLHAALDLVLS